MRFTCPTCRRTLEGTLAEIPTLPFCSPRCRAADLGHWLEGNYRIGSPLSEEDLDESPRAVEAAGRGDDSDDN